MKMHPKPTQPSRLFDKPPKERILEAAHNLFRLFGIRVSFGPIAHEAHSNVETAVKYFGYVERLVSKFVKSVIEEAEVYWRDVEAKYPSDPEGQLRFWMFFEQVRMDDPLRPEMLLSRSAAELAGADPRNEPLRGEIEQYWQAERRRVLKLCEAAKFREPRDLADKLLLLIHGARNERRAYGHHAPSRMLSQAGDDLMVAHGAVRKAPMTFRDDD
jgi:AcrR family transcriptional regulator